MKKNAEIVLITGASGLIGNALTNFLIGQGYRIKTLGRTKSNRKDVESFIWDVASNHLDNEALLDVDYIIHLAGAGVFNKRWTQKQKKILIESRAATANLLYQSVLANKNKPKAILSASGINYYGTHTSEKIYQEQDPPGNDFLAECTKVWENAIDQFQPICRTVKLRLGMVLSEKGGGLPSIANPVKWGVGAVLGSGKQYLPWIHVEDVCSMFLHGINNNLNGAYNAIVPHHVTNKEFTQITATVLNRKIVLPNAPGFLLRLVLGERANVILKGSRADSGKIEATGFQFKHKQLKDALKDLLTKNP